MVSTPESPMGAAPLVSICIPSYGRPQRLARLLESIDVSSERIEVVIAEDRSPRWQEVGERVRRFQEQSDLVVRYRENPENLGFDLNFLQMLALGRGHFVIFMGDDDYFAEGTLESYLDFLAEHRDAAYVLRSYYGDQGNGRIEPFRYLGADEQLQPGLETAVFAFKRSVSLAGLTFNRQVALEVVDRKFVGTLLIQLPIVAEIALTHPILYSNHPTAVAMQTFRADHAEFGSAEAEAGRFEVGSITANNSVNFSRGFIEIAREIELRHEVPFADAVARDLSRYAYPFLALQRKLGAGQFLRYARRLAAETGIDRTWHYWFYVAALLAFGETVCDRVILTIKRAIGRTPQL